jgi:hypothetical protein
VKAYDNGEVGITLESERATVRMHAVVPSPGKRAPYIAIGQITRLPNHVVLLSGFCGDLMRAHMWLLLQAMLAEGYRVAYLERIPGHSVPFGEAVQEGDFAGLWRIQLDTVHDRRRRRETNEDEQ